MRAKRSRDQRRRTRHLRRMRRWPLRADRDHVVNRMVRTRRAVVPSISKLASTVRTSSFVRHVPPSRSVRDGRRAVVHARLSLRWIASRTRHSVRLAERASAHRVDAPALDRFLARAGADVRAPSAPVRRALVVVMTHIARTHAFARHRDIRLVVGRTRRQSGRRRSNSSSSARRRWRFRLRATDCEHDARGAQHAAILSV